MAQIGSVMNALVVVLLAFIISKIPLADLNMFGIKPDLFVSLIILLSLVAALLQILESVADAARGLIAQVPK